MKNLSREQICSRTATNWENCDEKDIGSMDHLCLYKEGLLLILIGMAYDIYVRNFFVACFDYSMITDALISK